MNITKNGVTIIVDDAEIVRLALDRLNGRSYPTTLRGIIELTPAEIQSNYNRVQWAEGLIRQLPETHEGRNSWLLNYGTPTTSAKQNLSTAAPAIGECWPGQGGVYAGIARGRDGAPDYHLIVGLEHDGDIEWQPAMDWAPTVEVDGFRDFTLPWRREQSLLFANVPELFQERVYWSREQHASLSGSAWGQLFSFGYQHYWFKVSKLRARAVRRLVIQ